MPPIRYLAPTTVPDAVRLLQSDPDARLLAGGTDLLVQFHAGLKRPSAFVDLKRIPELIGIAIDREGARIGAATPVADLAVHGEFVRTWPGLAEAAALIGSTQIQHRGSLGGNLCNASPAADTPCALIVNHAQCVVEGPTGTRRVPADTFMMAPGRTVLGAGDILVAIHLPLPAPRSGDAYLRLTPRTEMDIAIVGAAVSVTVDDAGVCRAARVALAAVAPTPILVPDAARALIGTTIDDAALAQAAEAARAAARPIDDKRGTIDYRRQVAGVLTRRAAVLARDRATSTVRRDQARGH
jgi:CO/xanthine dehydrogenase FAD-binding subunit